MRVPYRLRLPGRRGLVVIIVLLVVVAGTGTWLLVRPGTSQAQSQPITYTVSKTTVKQTVSGSGTLEAARQADLDFAVSGTVTDVYVKAGDKVHKGQALARIDSAALEATYDSAKAALTAAYTAYDDDSDAGAGSTQLASDSAQIESARASLAQARDDLDDATLRATIGGTVAARNIDVGDTVTGSATSGSSGGTATPTASTGSSGSDGSTSSSTSAFTVLQPGRFTVTADVAADDIGSVKKGMQVTLTTSTSSSSSSSGGFPGGFPGGGFPGFGTRGNSTGSDSQSGQAGQAGPGGSDADSTTIFGTVSEVSMVADTSSSTTSFPVTIDVTGVHRKLYAGTSVTASITTKQLKNVLVVPAMALSSSGGKTYVQKVVDGETVKTEVKVGQTYGSQTRILKGLSAGDRVRLATVAMRRPSGSSGSSGSGGSGLSGFSGSSGSAGGSGLSGPPSFGGGR